MEKKILVCSGPSGVGKSSVIHKILERKPDIYFSVSATTREPRPSDVDGVTYRFLSREEFRKLIDTDALWEYNEYAGNYYGTPAAPLEEALAEGKTVLLDVDPNGAFHVRQHRPDATLVYIGAPSMAVVKARLESRGDTPPEKIAARLAQAQWENRQAARYDYIVINDDLDVCVGEVMSILRGEDEARRFTANNRKSVFEEELQYALSTDV